MLKDLTDFGLKRSKKGALVFYVAYLVLFILIGGLIAGLLASFTNSEGVFQLGLRAVNILIFLAVLAISFSIAWKKRILRDFRIIILILLAGILALWGGGILGLIVPAFLTTKPITKKEENREISD